MKYYETNYVDYINSVKTYNLHSTYKDLYKDVSFEDVPNCIFYGPPGIGKYSQVLKLIEQYSESSLHYEKKATIRMLHKDDYIIKISDVHYEVDMDLLGCNARTLWHEIYNHILEIIMTGHSKKGIIVCKNFEVTHPELLDVFYCYLNNICSSIQVKFFLICSNISCLPSNLMNDIEIIPFMRPKKTMYKKIIKYHSLKYKTEPIQKLDSEVNVNNIHNIKTLYTSSTTSGNSGISGHSEKSVIEKYNTNICRKIYDLITCDAHTIDLFALRETLYTILLYHQNVYDCFYTVLTFLYNNKYISSSDMFPIQIKLIEFSTLYNNNYRPIFHLERFALYLHTIVHRSNST